MAKIVCVLLQRRDLNVPWGFRLTGGTAAESNRPLIIHKVSPGTLASQQLCPGDVILGLEGRPAASMTLTEATSLIRSAKFNLEITVHKPPSNIASLLQPSRRHSTAATTTNQEQRRASFSGTLVRIPKTTRQCTSSSKTDEKCEMIQEEHQLNKRQSSQLTSGGNSPTVPASNNGPPAPPPMPSMVMMGGGAPPPPPPPPPGGLPSNRLGAEIESRGSRLGPPAAIQAAMGKDKKPFTYTPGGIDLSEIRSPRMARRICRNAAAEGVTATPTPAANTFPVSNTHVTMPPQIAVPVLPPPPPPQPMKTPIRPSPLAVQVNKPPPTVQNKPPPQQQQNTITMKSQPAPSPVTINNGNTETYKPLVLNNNVKPAPSNIYVQQQQQQQQPGHIYIAPAAPKDSGPQLGSLYIPPVTQESPQQSPGSPVRTNLSKAPMPWMNSSQVRQAPAPAQSPPTGMWSPPPSAQQETTPLASNTRIIPIHVEGRESPVNVQQGGNASRTRCVPIQMEGDNRSPVYTHNKFENNNLPHSVPSTPISPTPGLPGAPLQSRSFRVLQKITSRDESASDETGPQAAAMGQMGPPPPPPAMQQQQHQHQQQQQQQTRKLQLSSDDRQLMDRFRAQVDDDTYLHGEADPRYRGAAIPSRAFRMLQTMTDSVPGGSPEHNFQGGGSSDLTSPQAFPQHVYVPASEQGAQPEPRKYTGSCIPSRSFRMLQAMTAPEDCGPGQSDL